MTPAPSRFDENSGEIGFADERTETRLASQETVCVPLSHLTLIEANGEDAAGFLHNLTSNDIKKLPADKAQFSSLNTPKGRMLASFLVWRTEAGFNLALASDLQAGISKKLGMYVLRSKVKLATPARILLGLAGTGAEALLAGLELQPPGQDMGVIRTDKANVIRLAPDRYILDCPEDTVDALWGALLEGGAKAAGTAAWRWLDIHAGHPLITAASSDEFVAQMLNFELLGGVNFQKGCYPGQEIVARTQYLGKLKKRMYRAQVQEDSGVPVASMDLYAPEFGAQSCGKLVSVVAAPEAGFDVLAVMQISAFEAGEVHLGAPDGPRLALASLPYVID
ncbi:YgfZ/GcvT domain-containing protein [Candidatus Dactylopiibacterium carminicum]|nr:folate-binding protein [Candidatus Dactylopiibacterium carminicum]